MSVELETLKVNDIVEFRCLVGHEGKDWIIRGEGIVCRIRGEEYVDIRYYGTIYTLASHLIIRICGPYTKEQLLTHSTPEVRQLANAIIED